MSSRIWIGLLFLLFGVGFLMHQADVLDFSKVLHNKKQYTTASDMAKLLDYALDNGHFKAIFTKETFQTTSTTDHPNGVLLKSTVLTSLNKEEQNGFEILGGKSGTTYEAGQCWATLGLIEHREYISIVMGAPFLPATCTAKELAASPPELKFLHILINFNDIFWLTCFVTNTWFF